MNNRFLINSASGFLQTIISSIVIFVSIPFFINSFGTEIYGGFSLIMLLSNVNVLFTFGINNSLIKYLSEQGKSQESNYDIIASFLIVLAIIVPITILLIFYEKFFILSVLRLSGELYENGVRVLYIAIVISNAVYFCGQIFIGILDSIEKIYLSNFFQSIYSIFYWLSILVISFWFNSLNLIALSVMLTTFLWFVIVVVFSLSNWGKLDFSGIGDNLYRVVKKQFFYGYKLSLSTLLSFFFEPFSKLLISHYIGVKEVGYYDLAIRVRNQLWNLVSKLLYPLIPIIASTKEKEKIATIISFAQQKLVQILIPVVVIIMFVSESFVSLFIKEDMEVITYGIRILILSFFITIIVLPTYYFLMIKGYQVKTILMQSVNILTNAFFFMLFYQILHYETILYSNLLSVILSFLMCYIYGKKYLNVELFKSSLNLSKVFLIMVILLIFSWMYFFFVEQILLRVFIYPVLSILLLILIMRFVRLFTENEIQKVFSNSKNIYRILNTLFIRKT